MQLAIDRLTKQYGQTIALDRVDLALSEGVYGLLGANGSGKTTMMRILCGILRPTSGAVRYNECDISGLGESYRELLGYLPQDFGYYPDFTAYKFMLYIASLKGLNANYAKEKSVELLDMVGLSGERNRKIKTFSGGMKQRLGIAQAMLNDPQILILDEPTAGLDPKERVRFRNLLSSFAKDKIVILSTHIVSDVEYIANEILILKKGSLLSRGKPQEILTEIDGCTWECSVRAGQAEKLRSLHTISNEKNQQDVVVMRIVSKQKPCDSAISVEPCLEDLYLYYFSEERNEKNNTL